MTSGRRAFYLSGVGKRKCPCSVFPLPFTVSIGTAELWGGRVGGERWLKQRTCDFAGGKKSKVMNYSTEYSATTFPLSGRHGGPPRLRVPFCRAMDKG